MTHRDALTELSVERYLLDELDGDARDRFEAHLFDCIACAADVKSGLLFLEAARQELRVEQTATTPLPLAAKSTTGLREWWNRLMQPLILAPALAASLAVVVYQSAVILPRVETQLALAQAPSIEDTLVLANAGQRGDTSLPEVVAPAGGHYQLAVDLPPAPGATAYRCTLYDPSSKAVWHVDIPVAQEKDSVKITVPVAATGPGADLLVVQAIGPGTALTNLASYKYNLRLATY